VKAHARHHDGRDIIPAPAGGCPGGDTAPTAAAPGDGTTTPGTPAAGGPATGIAGPIVTALETLGVPAGSVPGAVLGAFATSPTGESTPGTVAGVETAPAGAVLGEVDEQAPGAVLGEMDQQAPGAVAPATATRENGADGGSLPFTGLELWLVVAAGLALVLAGVAARRAQSRGATSA
jgi:hypothetical protein